MNTRTEWYAQHSPYRLRYELIGFQRRDDGQQCVLRTEVTVVDHKAGYMVEEPTLSFNEDEAQQIMNALWNTGLRPNNGAGAVAHTESLQAHLDDLRTVAFHALKIVPK